MTLIDYDALNISDVDMDSNYIYLKIKRDDVSIPFLPFKKDLKEWVEHNLAKPIDTTKPVDTTKVVYCKYCKHHNNCFIEDMIKTEGYSDGYCAAGEYLTNKILNK